MSINSANNLGFSTGLLTFDDANIIFDAVITMNSKYFNDLCHEMNNDNDLIEIKCFNDKIVFVCEKENKTIKTTFRTSSHNVHIAYSNNYFGYMISGIFELKNLVLLSKLSLSNNIEIYMKNGFPLVIEFNITNLGKMILCLSPVVKKMTHDVFSFDITI